MHVGRWCTHPDHLYDLVQRGEHRRSLKKKIKHKSTVTSGSRAPTGEVASEVPPTSDTTPLQSTAQCIFPLAGSLMRGAPRLVWLTALQRRSRRRGRNREPLRLSLSSKVLCSSSAKSFSEPMSRARPRKLNRLARLFLRGEKKDPRILRRDCEKGERAAVRKRTREYEVGGKHEASICC